jgi:hypothetical protein
MPRQVSVRLWRVGKRHRQGATLRQALDQVWGIGPPGDRQRQMAPGVLCRLERYEPQAGVVGGEMTRVRHEDFPAEIHPHGAVALNVNVPIGDGVAFRFREADHTLAFQYDDRILAAGKFLDYLEALVPEALFNLDPIADERELARFHADPLKKVTIRLASPVDVVANEDNMQAAATAFRRLGADYGAPQVTLQLSVGNGGGFLNQAAKGMIEGFLRSVGANDVRSAKAVPGGAGRTKEVNLLDALFSHKEEVESSRDLVENYAIRQRLLARVLDGQR